MSEEQYSLVDDVALIFAHQSPEYISKFVTNMLCEKCPPDVKNTCAEDCKRPDVDLDAPCWEAWQEAAAKIRKKDKEHEK